MKHARRMRPLAIAAACGLSLAACQQDGGKDKGRPPPVHSSLAGPGVPAQSAEELNTPLAQVDDVVITIGEFQGQLNRQSPYIRARYTSLEQKKEFLDSMIRFEILAKEAMRRGLDKDPEVVRVMKEVMIQKLVKDEFDRTLTPDSITDDEMKAYYDANLTEYQKPEEVRVSAIILKSKGQATRVATEAQGDAGKTNKGFRDLVERYSQDADSKLRGGDLRYLSQGTTDVPRPVVDAAFALANIGDVSGPIDAGKGTWYILKETAHRKAMTRSFEDARAQIRNQLYRDKRVSAQKSFLDGLRQKAKIAVFDDALAKVHVDTSGAAGDGHGHQLPSLPPSPHPADPTAPPPSPSP
jgi:PPIC-type PPIASE domain